jgi:hypothetical protein
LAIKPASGTILRRQLWRWRRMFIPLMMLAVDANGVVALRAMKLMPRRQ